VEWDRRIQNRRLSGVAERCLAGEWLKKKHCCHASATLRQVPSPAIIYIYSSVWHGMEDVSWLAPLNVRIRTWGRDVANLAPAKKMKIKIKIGVKKKKKKRARQIKGPCRMTPRSGEQRLPGHHHGERALSPPTSCRRKDPLIRHDPSAPQRPNIGAYELDVARNSRQPAKHG
jgi:hypothetical protein